MITWPDDIIDDIAKRRSVLYLGSGVSANSVSSTGKHPATWESFLRNIVNKPDNVGVKPIVESLLAKRII